MVFIRFCGMRYKKYLQLAWVGHMGGTGAGGTVRQARW